MVNQLQERQNSHEAEVAATQLAEHHTMVEQEVTNYMVNQLAEDQSLATQHQNADIINEHNNQNI